MKALRFVGGSGMFMAILLAISFVGVTVPSTEAAYTWYRSAQYYPYYYYNLNYFPYRYVYTYGGYYYIYDPSGDLASQVESLKSQLEKSQADRDQLAAQAQQLTTQIDSMNKQMDDMKAQMNNMNLQYGKQLSDMQNANRALQASLDGMRAQNDILLVVVAILGAGIVGLVLRRSAFSPAGRSKRQTSR